MRWTLVVVSLLSSFAFADVPGLAAYKRGDHQMAARSLKQTLTSDSLSQINAAQARVYLAASYFALGADAAAELNQTPDAELRRYRNLSVVISGGVQLIF